VHRAACSSPQREKALVDTLADNLVARVEKLIQAGKEPLLSGTAPSLAIRELLQRNDALEDALREIAREVEKLTPA
jgi:hypothetical protein